MGRPRRHGKKKPTRKKPRTYARGTLETNPRGYGFVKTTEGDFFIPESKMNGAFDGDLVEVSGMAPKGPSRGSGTHARRGKGASSERRIEGRVVRVLDRAHDYLIGRYEIAGPFGIVIPDDPRINYDIFTPLSEGGDIPEGSLVKVRILEYPTRRSSATGTVEEVLGSSEDGSLMIERIIARHNLETRFSEGALTEATAATLDIPAALSDGYRDIRDRFVFTIDPDDAKDFDDALSIGILSAGEVSRMDLFTTRDLKRGLITGAPGLKADATVVRLGVHIADVSRYVPWGGSLDLDARKRATSTYLVDRVIPMIPPALSDDLCSLRPGVDRLCMTADLYVTEDAKLVAYDLYPAIMNSSLRLTYGQALEILRGEGCAQVLAASSSDASSVQDVPRLLRIASSLAKARERYRESLGALEFETKEAKVILGEDGEPLSIEIREKNDATQLIEEAMIFANEIVACHLLSHDQPCAYRVHEQPAKDALVGLIPPLQGFRWFTKTMAEGVRAGDPFALQSILEACAGRPEAEMVTMLILRTMMRAVYSPEDIGHYGLGLAAYCHFTSPIRRYPDLIVHRMLKALLGKRPGLFDQEAASLKWLCEHSSEMERVAESAGFDSQKAKIVEYMAGYLGLEFPAIISGVTTYGIYVRLENCAEGLVPIRALGSEYFAFDAARYVLKGTDTGREYRLGQRIDVRLVKADLVACHLDFEPVSS